MLSNSDAKAVLDEIRAILSLPDSNEDPVVILDTVRKLEKVVKAVPRMESFITTISRNLAEDGSSNPIPLE